MIVVARVRTTPSGIGWAKFLAIGNVKAVQECGRPPPA
jgi:hypothetical protein